MATQITNTADLQSKVTLPDQTEATFDNVSNEVTLQNISEQFTKVKSSAKQYVLPNEEIQQQIVLTNNSTFEISAIKITDTLSEGATFVAGSLTVNDTPYPDVDITTTFDITETISASGELNIGYKILIDSEPTVDTITNTATINYTADSTELTENTNVVTLNIVNNAITVTKYQSKDVAIKGETVEYSFVVSNLGDYTNTEVVFKDTLPEGVTFVTGSITIDNTSQPDYDPTVGFSLNDLNPSDVVDIKFNVTVD